MKASCKEQESDYKGFEQGPIRPPSEARSLLIRVTRNCPWNRCTFCPVYKGTRFSLRPLEHVIKDIDAVHGHVDRLRKQADGSGHIGREQLASVSGGLSEADMQAFHAALNWGAGGMRSVFLQDANSLLIKPSDLITILKHLKHRFPWIERITSYARSHTVARIADTDLSAMAAAGLNRIHIGLESGAAPVLEMVQKGSTPELHVKAGRKVRSAGIELSEYVMPGLGGLALSETHARETARVLNQINPDFIRLRTLAIPNSIPLYDDWVQGRFEKCTDHEMAREILLFLEHLDGIESMIKSDHILNLFEEVEGRLPEDKARMTGVVRAFLEMSATDRMVYQVGRRIGVFSRLADLSDRSRRQQAEAACRRFGITPENVDATIDELMKRFI